MFFELPQNAGGTDPGGADISGRCVDPCEEYITGRDINLGIADIGIAAVDEQVKYADVGVAAIGSRLQLGGNAVAGVVLVVGVVHQQGPDGRVGLGTGAGGAAGRAGRALQNA